MSSGSYDASINCSRCEALLQKVGMAFSNFRGTANPISPSQTRSMSQHQKPFSDITVSYWYMRVCIHRFWMILVNESNHVFLKYLCLSLLNGKQFWREKSTIRVSCSAGSGAQANLTNRRDMRFWRGRRQSGTLAPSRETSVITAKDDDNDVNDVDDGDHDDDGDENEQQQEERMHAATIQEFPIDMPLCSKYGYRNGRASCCSISKTRLDSTRHD